MSTPSDETYSENPKDRRGRVLSRLELTRAEFVAHSSGERAALSSSKNGLTSPAIRQYMGVTLLTSPNAQMIAAVLVGSVLFGPRRLIAIAALPILRVWLNQTIRRFSANIAR
ncbi:hypothetical protein [uncultured Caballeronia sp.]|uniref:hypothetical protein n=1 Tax=uncultured Caballeronia sp. TaxID=1827198 RepID=UPI0035CA911C